MATHRPVDREMGHRTEMEPRGHGEEGPVKIFPDPRASCPPSTPVPPHREQKAEQGHRE